MKNINELSLYSLLNKNKIDDLSKSQIDKVISGHTIPPDLKVNLLNIKEVSAYGKLDGEINIFLFLLFRSCHEVLLLYSEKYFLNIQIF